MVTFTEIGGNLTVYSPETFESILISKSSTPDYDMILSYIKQESADFEFLKFLLPERNNLKFSGHEIVNSVYDNTIQVPYYISELLTDENSLDFKNSKQTIFSFMNKYSKFNEEKRNRIDTFFIKNKAVFTTDGGFIINNGTQLEYYNNICYSENSEPYKCYNFPSLTLFNKVKFVDIKSLPVLSVIFASLLKKENLTKKDIQQEFFELFNNNNFNESYSKDELLIISIQAYLSR